ncbi:MAG: hypothetical protein HY806_01065 [Nitrospirae bacterium]|nr:hypothetical protein [Nitrospirota bacterium]
MGQAVAVSFEEENIKIVHASFKGKNFLISPTETIPEDQFDAYLKKERSKEFIVTYDFKETYHNVITIPVVKTKYLEKIVESEIRKTTELKDFSFIYTLIGERVVENKKIMEVSYFAARNDEIKNSVKRFYDNGKIVRALYPAVYSAVPIFESRDEAVLGVLDTKTEKTAFLIKKGVIYFIRKFKSLSEDLTDLDLQDINMTINYCFQNFRINPGLVLLAGNLSMLYNVSASPLAPAASFRKPDYMQCTKETFNDFILPIYSFSASKASNILSSEFKNLYTLRNYMLYAIKAFIVLTVLCLGFLLYKADSVLDKRDFLLSAEKGNTDIEKILSEYTVKEAELKRYSPVLNLINKASPEIEPLLIALSEMDLKTSKIDVIEANAADNSFSILITGTLGADTYASTQAAFQDLLISIGRIKNISITEKTADLDKKTFSFRMNYKISGQAAGRP